MKIWKSGDAVGVTPPNHFGGLNVLDIVPFKDRNFSIQVSKAPPGGSGALHHHENWAQLFYVIEGELSFDTGSENFTLTEGQAVLFEPNDPHATENRSDRLSISLVVTVIQD